MDLQSFVFSYEICKESEHHVHELHNRMYRQAGAVLQGHLMRGRFAPRLDLPHNWKGTNEY